MIELQLDEFLKDLYKAECRQTERYAKALTVSMIINAVLLLALIFGR